jgi:hypothetical protein
VIVPMLVVSRIIVFIAVIDMDLMVSMVMVDTVMESMVLVVIDLMVSWWW